jgi:hypothetical protein
VIGRTLIAALALASTTLSAEMPKDPAKWGREAKTKLSHALKDAPSARWARLFVSSWSWKGERYPTLCGEVNAKNSYGGYTGFKRFYFHPETGYSFEDTHPDVFDDLWNENCGAKVADVR